LLITEAKYGFQCSMDETKIDFTTLSIFAAVARYSSFRRAAIELDMPVATVSRKISKLEEKLNAQLLQRTTRSVILTEMGEQLLNEIVEPLSKLDDATHRAAQRQDTISGLVKIATTYTLAETNILPVLTQLRRDWPQIRVQLILNEDVVNIRSERIDFAVRAGKLQDPSLISRKICTHQFIRYTTPNMQKIPNPGFVTYGMMLRDSVPPNIEVNDMRIIHQLVLTNQGEAWLLDVMSMEDERTGKLIRVSGAKVFSVDISLVFGSKKFIPKRVRHVMNAIIEHANQYTREVEILQAKLTA